MMVPKRRYLSYLRERWWVVLFCLVFTLSATLVYETIRTPLFTSFSQIYLVNTPRLDANDMFSGEDQTYFGTQIELLKSAPIVGAAMQKVGIQVPLGEKNPYKIEVVQPLKTSILVLQATGPDPDVTQHYLQSIVDGYMNYKKQTHISTSQDVLDSLRDQLSTKEAEMQADEDKLTDFERSNNVAVLDQESKSAGEYLSDLNLQLSQDKLHAKMLSDQIEAETPDPGAADATNVATTASAVIGSGDTNLATASAQAAGAVLTNAIASAVSGGPAQTVTQLLMPPTTNEVEAATDAYLNQTRIQLAQLIANKEDNLRYMGQHGFDEQVSRLQKTIAILQDQDRTEKIAELTDLQKRLTAVQSALPPIEAKVIQAFNLLTRAQSLKDNVTRDQGYYDHLLGTVQSVDLNKNVQQEGLSVLQPATAPQPEIRYLPIRVAVAAVLGLLLGLGLAYGWYLLDDRFVSFHDITDQFGETLIGLVPQVKVPRKQPAQALLAEVDGRHHYLESFRHLRSALLLSAAAESRPQILLFTSSTSAEGKTTVSVNLARLLARSGLRVVLVDADDQGGGLQRLMGEKDQPGVLDYLRGNAEAGTVVYPTGCEGLSFVPSGTHNATSEGLFLRPRLGHLLADLRRTHDFVIIDGPPILASDDAAMLVPHADTVILVTRPFYSRSRLVRQALDMLYQRQAKNVNIIMNRARPDDLAGHQAMRGVTRRAVALKV